ncbi:MAG TPA: hypothetical protein VFW98_16605 [Gemmatimonadaceae bacterium]|nr:hypothetical protein [Gemmatimonadaceae bacterium]
MARRFNPASSHTALCLAVLLLAAASPAAAQHVTTRPPPAAVPAARRFILDADVGSYFDAADLGDDRSQRGLLLRVRASYAPSVLAMHGDPLRWRDKLALRPAARGTRTATLSPSLWRTSWLVFR